MSSKNEIPDTFSPSETLLNLLRFSILIQVLVQVWVVIEYGSSINTYFFGTYQVADETLILCDKIGCFVLVFFCLGLFHKKFSGLMWLVALLFLLLAIFAMIDGGSRFAGTIPLAHAVRIFLPLTYWFVSREEARFKVMGLQILRWAVAITFTAHGIECLMANANFIDYIIGSADGLLGLAVTEVQAVAALKVIGVMDVVLSIIFLTTRWKWVALHLCFWGAVSALSRTTSGDFEFNWYKTLVRVANATGPLVIYLWWRSTGKEKTDINSESP